MLCGDIEHNPGLTFLIITAVINAGHTSVSANPDYGSGDPTPTATYQSETPWCYHPIPYDQDGVSGRELFFSSVNRVKSGHIRLLSVQEGCDLLESDRYECGTGGHDQQQCDERNCCWHPVLAPPDAHDYIEWLQRDSKFAEDDNTTTTTTTPTTTVLTTAETTTTTTTTPTTTVLTTAETTTNKSLPIETTITFTTPLPETTTTLIGSTEPVMTTTETPMGLVCSHVPSASWKIQRGYVFFKYRYDYVSHEKWKAAPIGGLQASHFATYSGSEIRWDCQLFGTDGASWISLYTGGRIDVQNRLRMDFGSRTVHLMQTQAPYNRITLDENYLYSVLPIESESKPAVVDNPNGVFPYNADWKSLAMEWSRWIPHESGTGYDHSPFDWAHTDYTRTFASLPGTPYVQSSAFEDGYDPSNKTDWQVDPFGTCFAPYHDCAEGETTTIEHRYTAIFNSSMESEPEGDAALMRHKFCCELTNTLGLTLNETIDHDSRLQRAATLGGLKNFKYYLSSSLRWKDKHDLFICERFGTTQSRTPDPVLAIWPTGEYITEMAVCVWERLPLGSCQTSETCPQVLTPVGTEYAVHPDDDNYYIGITQHPCPFTDCYTTKVDCEISTFEVAERNKEGYCVHYGANQFGFLKKRKVRAIRFTNSYLANNDAPGATYTELGIVASGPKVANRIVTITLIGYTKMIVGDLGTTVPQFTASKGFDGYLSTTHGSKLKYSAHGQSGKTDMYDISTTGNTLSFQARQMGRAALTQTYEKTKYKIDGNGLVPYTRYLIDRYSTSLYLSVYIYFEYLFLCIALTLAIIRQVLLVEHNKGWVKFFMFFVHFFLFFIAFDVLLHLCILDIPLAIFTLVIYCASGKNISPTRWFYRMAIKPGMTTNIKCGGCSTSSNKSNYKLLPHHLKLFGIGIILLPLACAHMEGTMGSHHQVDIRTLKRGNVHTYSSESRWISMAPNVGSFHTVSGIDNEGNEVLRIEITVNEAGMDSACTYDYSYQGAAKEKYVWDAAWSEMCWCHWNPYSSCLITEKEQKIVSSRESSPSQAGRVTDARCGSQSDPDFDDFDWPTDDMLKKYILSHHGFYEHCCFNGLMQRGEHASICSSWGTGELPQVHAHSCAHGSTTVVLFVKILNPMTGAVYYESDISFERSDIVYQDDTVVMTADLSEMSTGPQGRILTTDDGHDMPIMVMSGGMPFTTTDSLGLKTLGSQAGYALAYTAEHPHASEGDCFFPYPSHLNPGNINIVYPDLASSTGCIHETRYGAPDSYSRSRNAAIDGGPECEEGDESEWCVTFQEIRPVLSLKSINCPGTLKLNIAISGIDVSITDEGDSLSAEHLTILSVNGSWGVQGSDMTISSTKTGTAWFHRKFCYPASGSITFVAGETTTVKLISVSQFTNTMTLSDWTTITFPREWFSPPDVWVPDPECCITDGTPDDGDFEDHWPDWFWTMISILIVVVIVIAAYFVIKALLPLFMMAAMSQPRPHRE